MYKYAQHAHYDWYRSNSSSRRVALGVSPSEPIADTTKISEPYYVRVTEQWGGFVVLVLLACANFTLHPLYSTWYIKSARTSSIEYQAVL